MRDEVLCAWRDQIQHAVSKEFPEFEQVTKRVRGEPRQLLKYQWHPHAGLWCYIAFRPLDSEAFDAFVGWSTSDRFPISDGGGSPKDLTDFEAPNALAWSAELVPRHGAVHWSFWNPSPDLLDNPAAFAEAYAREFTRTLSLTEAGELVRPAVESGIAEVRDFGIPYLRGRVAYEMEKKGP